MRMINRVGSYLRFDRVESLFDTEFEGGGHFHDLFLFGMAVAGD